jgi:hypothetical protein
MADASCHLSQYMLARLTMFTPFLFQNLIHQPFMLGYLYPFSPPEMQMILKITLIHVH